MSFQKSDAKQHNVTSSQCIIFKKIIATEAYGINPINEFSDQY